MTQGCIDGNKRLISVLYAVWGHKF